MCRKIIIINLYTRRWILYGPNASVAWRKIFEFIPIEEDLLIQSWKKKGYQKWIYLLALWASL
jgi:hypothetical protein